MDQMPTAVLPRLAFLTYAQVLVKLLFKKKGKSIHRLNVFPINYPKSEKIMKEDFLKQLIQMLPLISVSDDRCKGGDHTLKDLKTSVLENSTSASPFCKFQIRQT